MKVFGLGLSKTGTTTLCAALNVLGVRATHGPLDQATKQEIMRGQSKLSVFDEYDAIADIPMALRYIDLDRAYPGSKFILTVRDMDAWMLSAEKHFTRHKPNEWMAFNRAYAYGSVEWHPERYRIAHEQHVKNVKDYFAGRDDLLVYDLCGGEGWDKLCGFLGKLVPSVPFPWENKAPKKEVKLI